MRETACPVWREGRPGSTGLPYPDLFVRLVSVGAEQAPLSVGRCSVFHAVKTLHEGLSGDFPRKMEERISKVGKKAAKMRSVFLHKNVQHAVDELWVSRRVGQGESGDVGRE